LKSSEFVCAVDVGTASARAGIFDRTGRLLARAEHPILINQPEPTHAEHDSEDIWAAVRHVVRAAVAKSRIDAAQISAIGFDATCSLVVRGAGGGQVSCSTSGEQRWDTISWFDHRALKEAHECSRTGHEVLRFVGGVMSPEMQIPKLMWLKRHMPQSWANAQHFFDLADFLTWRACGSNARSQCTLTCKWTYLAHAGGWQPDFLHTVDLADMRAQGGVPFEATPVGTRIGQLSNKAAMELGLPAGCAVATGLIDAYAGMLGVIGHYAASPGRLALVAGTSSCVITQSSKPGFIESFWGPYLGAGLPDVWVAEGGQSATGALLDHLVATHVAGGVPSADRHVAIVKRIQALRAADPEFGTEMHVLPDFHGNRSPLGEPDARGVIVGLTLDNSFDALCKLYWRSCVAIALGVRHIVEHMRDSGVPVEHLHVAGGHTRNPLLMQLYADVTGVPVVETDTEDAVLLGSAMVAMSALEREPDLAEACHAMRQTERIRKANPAAKAALERDYAAFLLLHRQQAELRALTSS
jgi:FGGY-family pentulose kinase